MSGIDRLNQLKGAGFSDGEVAQWATDKRKELGDAGFNDAEVNQWFGQKEFNPEPVKAHFEQTIKAAVDATKDESGQQTKPFSWSDAFEAGWQGSSAGLAMRGKAPDKVLPENAEWQQRWASGAASLAGDLPAGVAGFLIGGGAGAESGPGAVVTGTAGAFALPAALRSVMMDSYKNGEAKTPGEFLDRVKDVFLDTGKAYITGAATGAAGLVAAPLAGATTLGKVIVPTAAELATMVTTSKGFEGHLPTAQDFVDASLLLVGAKLATKGGETLSDVYRQTGKTPAQVVQEAKLDPTIHQDIAAGNVPAAYGHFVDPSLKAEEAAPVLKAEPVVTEPPVVGTPEAAQANILSKVQVGGKNKTEAYDWNSFYKDSVDDLHPIRVAVQEMTGGENLAPSKDPYVLARLTKGSFGKADHFLNHAPFDFNTFENVGKPLAEIVKPFKKEMDGLRAYVVAKRAVDLEARGIKSGFDSADAKAVLAEGDKKYAAAAQDLVDYQNHVTKYLKDSGILSSEAYDAILEANKNYVPFHRVIDNPTAPLGKGLTVSDPIKKIRGSERDVIDPIESIIKNTYAYIAMADRNAANAKFVELAEKTENPEAFAKKINAPVRPVTTSDSEMSSFLKGEGIDAVPEKALTVFRAIRQPLAENEIAVYRKGQRQVYELDHEVAAAFKATDKELTNLLMKMLAAPAKIFRAGTTLNLDFMPRNLIRDQLDATINSRNGFIPVLDSIRGLASLIGKDEHYQDWLKSGGANSTFVSMDRRYLQDSVIKLEGGKSLQEYIKGELDSKWGIVKLPWNLVTFLPGKGVDALRVAGELTENMTRLGEFRKATAGKSSKAVIQDAGYQSREITLDFQRAGAKTRAYNQITAFFNAQIQGVDRIARQFKEKPIATVAKVTASITMPSVLLWLSQHDDPRWKEIPDYQKFTSWIIMTDKNIYRIPKPHETGLIFGSGVESFLQFMKDRDPESVKALAKTIFNAFTPGFVPTAATPVIEQFANKSTFTGSPIVPSDVEKLLPEYQYTAYTTELTKQLGKMVGTVPGVGDTNTASPAVIENYIRQWSGGLGMYALQIADAALRKTGALPDPVKSADTLADIPVIKAFIVRYPSGSAQSIQSFYDNYESNKRVFDSIQYKAKEGDFAEVQRLTKANPLAMAQMDGIKDSLSEMQKLVRLVWKNPDIPAQEKRQLVDATYYQMIEAAGLGNKLLRETKAAMAQ